MEFFSVTVVLGLMIGLICAILIARWGWREVRQYVHARETIRRLSRR